MEPERKPDDPPEPTGPQPVQNPFGTGEAQLDPQQLMQVILQRQQKIDQQQQQQDKQNNSQQ